MFAAFILKSGKTRAAWAKQLGVSRSYLSDVLNGKSRPSLELASMIERETDGVVVASSWIPDHRQTAQAQETAA